MKQHIHEYFGGVCICGKKQPIYRNGKEVKLSDLSGVKIAYKPKSKRIHSEFQLFIDDLMTYLNEDVYKKGNFAKYAGIVKRVGIQQARIWIKEMKQRGIKSPRYFMGIYKNFNKTK